MKPGYIYVLVHPSDPTLVKVGRTTQKLERRIAQHNTDHAKIAGQIVKESGQKWELKEYIEVPDPVHAEAAFWGATGLADVPYRGGVEVARIGARVGKPVREIGHRIVGDHGFDVRGMGRDQQAIHASL